MRSFRTNRIAPVLLAGALSFGVAACGEDEGTDVDTEVDEGSEMEDMESEMESEGSEMMSEGSEMESEMDSEMMSEEEG